jgi:predicted PurR-regulated permease PerM
MSTTDGRSDSGEAADRPAYAVRPAPTVVTDQSGDGEKRQATREAVAELPKDVRSISVLILATLAVFYTLYLAREIAVPIALALVLKLLLQPVVRFMNGRLGVPVALASLAMVILVFAVIAAVAFSISLPAAGWLAKAPETLPALQERLAFLRGPIDAVQRALGQLGGASPGGESGIQSMTGWVAGVVGRAASGMGAFLGGFFETMIILFFLLANGGTFLRHLVEILPRLRAKKEAVELSGEIEEQISGYLLTITVMNLLVGIGTGSLMWLCGAGDPLLWGTVGFLLNYVPVLGPLTGVLVFFVVGLLSFPSPWWAFVPAGGYLAIHVAEGEMITPHLLARRFTLNPVLVMVSLMFWYWMWGVPGALLAVPLLAIFKIVCDHIKPLMPIGHFIGA